MKKITMNDWLTILILLFPILDACSFLGQEFFQSFPVSPTAIFRILFLGGLLLYIFLHDGKSRKWICGGIGLYLVYTIVHLWIYRSQYDGFSYGTWKMEIQYLLNYSYMIFLFGSINWFWKQKKITNIDRLFQGLLIVYLSIIFLSLITGTSSATYLDGTGEKSWFLSGNSLGASLSLLYFANLIILNKQNWKLQSILLLGTAIFMMFFLGSRVGLYGILLLTICYLLIQLFFSCRDWLFAHKGLVITGFILFFVSSLFLGKTLLIRQRNLDAIANQTIDPLTGEIAHVTGDTIQIVKEIQAGTMENMKEERQSAYLTLYKQANHYQVKNTDRRTQQLIYHTIFFQKNKDPFLFLFGNGYLNHHGELVLEMETIALFYNFGILGFILFFGLFLSFFLIGMKQLKSQILKGNASYCLFLFGILFAILLSTFTGYVYFNPTTALIIILMNISLFAVERKTI